MLDLPPEILERILSSLIQIVSSERKSAVNLTAAGQLREIALTCRYLRVLTESSKVWQCLCLVEFGCTVVRNDAKYFYSEVLMKYGGMLGRFFISPAWRGDQRLTYIKCMFNKETESINLVKCGLPSLSRFLHPNSSSLIASVTLNSSDKAEVSCKSCQCHSPDLLRHTDRHTDQHTDQHSIDIRLVQNYYTLTFIPPSSRLTSINITHTTFLGHTVSDFYPALPLHAPRVQAGVVRDGYFVGVGLHSTVLELCYLQCTESGIMFHTAHRQTVSDRHRGLPVRQDAIIADYSAAIKLIKSDSGISFINDSMRMCVEWRMKRKLSDKTFNLELYLGFLFIPGVAPPSTYQLMLRGYLEGAQPDQVMDCILVVFNENCVGVIEGGVVYLYKRLH